MNRYKFRAECQADVDRVLVALMQANYLVNFCIRPISRKLIGMPDRLVEITTITDLGTLQSVIADLPDVHVVKETLQHAENYTGDRSDSIMVTIQNPRDESTRTVTQHQADRLSELGLIHWCDSCRLYHIDSYTTWQQIDFHMKRLDPDPVEEQERNTPAPMTDEDLEPVSIKADGRELVVTQSQADYLKELDMIGWDDNQQCYHPRDTSWNVIKDTIADMPGKEA